MNTDKLIAAAVASEYAQTTSRKVIALKKLDKLYEVKHTLMIFNLL